MNSLPDFSEQFGEENVYLIEGATHSTVVNKAFLEDTGEHVGNGGNGHSDLIEWMIDYKDDNGINGSGWKISDNKKTLTKTYTANETETISVYNADGNESNKIQVVIENIDKILPQIDISYNITEMTNNDVQVTITANEEIQSLPGWELSLSKKTLTKTYTKNQTETIAVYDLAGNKSQEKQIIINNIDKQKPELTVNYDITEKTNSNVQVTIIANEQIQGVTGWSLSENNKILTKIFTNNSEETITVYDLAGNKSQVEISVQNIDRTAPKIGISYSNETKTNKDVIVTITSDEKIQEVNEWKLSNDKKVLTKTFTENETETLEIKDLAGNTTKIEINISNIDKTVPEINIEYSTTQKTNQNIVVTITSNEEIQKVSGWELSTNKKALTKTYIENQTEAIAVYDLAGNQSEEKQIIINNIDKQKPELTINYDITEKTNSNVQVTIIANEQIQGVTGWILSDNNKVLTKTFKNNSQETITIYDLVGNGTQVLVSIQNIDKIAPTIELDYSEENLTNDDITVTITANEPIQEVTDWDLSTNKKTLTKTYKNNKTETLEIKDLAGNTTKIEINISNIDKIAPEINIQYSTTQKTNQNIVVTITSNEEIQKVSGWELSTNKKTLTKTYFENQTETIAIYDLAGNKSEEKQIIISNIDKVKPELTVTYSKNEITNGNVTVTIVANEPIQEVTGWKLSNDKLTLSKTYEENITEKIEIKDLVGNITEVNINLINIDTTKPELTVSYSSKEEMTNKDVVVTITSNEEIQKVTEPADWSLSDNNKVLTKTFTDNSEETITVYDLVGNESQVQVSVQNIDKAAPQIGITYSNESKTNKDVIVTITSDEKIQEVTGWKLSNDNKVLTKTFTENKSETIEVYDLVGNITKSTINITNIDKIKPAVELNYSERNPTNNNVIVTITSTEEIQEVTEPIGWSLSDNKVLTKTFTANKEEAITIYDLAGNKSQVQVSVQNIDKKAPEVQVKTNKEGITNEDVLVTITSNEKIQEIDGWKLSDDKLTLTKIYDNNIQEKIEIKDLVGNVTEVNINLINIDKTNPIIRLDYSEEELTNADVIVVITSDEEMQEIPDWELSSDKKTLTKTYGKNQKETIEIKDLAGNITKIEINVTNIDKTAPEAKIEYSNTKKTNQDVIVRITSNEEIQEVSGWQLSTNKKILEKSYQKNTKEIITIKDLAGNIVEKAIDITNIDKENPVVEVKYSFIDNNKEVMVKVISNEELQTVEGWEISKDKKTLTKTYQKNTKQTIEVKDLIGNITRVEIKIDNIQEEPITEPDKDTLDKVDDTEQDKDTSDKINDSISPDKLPDTGISKTLILGFIIFSISLGITVSKLKKYRGV